ncbi:MAG TPA: hypothetical protein VFA66_01740 [Gaiellaceae bacterium]|nr:hypothetical protein [Gaiellaceae bacterium]
MTVENATTPTNTPAGTAPFTPPKAAVTKTTPKSTTHHVQTAGETKGAVTPKVSSGQLPFTGLALWIPLGAGFVLIALGLTVRTKARRSNSQAH